MANAWIEQIFAAQIVQLEGIVRRKKADVHRHSSFAELLEYVRDEQFHLIETGDQYIAVCNPGVLKIHC
jgi:hypothetical protein